MPRKKVPAQTITVEAKPTSLNKTDAKKLVARINNHMLTAGDHLNSARLLLLELYQGEGWKALGYTSWRACVDTEFEASQTHLYRQLKAAQVEAEISPIGEIGQIPESQLRPLAKLPEGSRAEAWEEVQETTNGKPTAKAVEEVVGKRLKPSPTRIEPQFQEGDVVQGRDSDGKLFRGVVSFISFNYVGLITEPGRGVQPIRLETAELLEKAPTPGPIVLPNPVTSCLDCAHLHNENQVEDDEDFCGFYGQYLGALTGCEHYAKQLTIEVDAPEPPTASPDRPLEVGDWVRSIGASVAAQVLQIKGTMAFVRVVDTAAREFWIALKNLERTEPPARICQDCKYYQADYEDYPDYCTWFSEEIEEGEGGYAANCEQFQLYQELVDLSQEHYTPDHIQEAVIKVLSQIDLDPCSNSKEAPNIHATKHYVRRDDGLCRPWSGKVYLNPPYSPNGTIAHWIQKLVDEYDECEVTEAIALVPASTDTQWFKLLRGYPICFLEGRLKFKNPTNESPAPFPSAIVYLGENRGRFFEVFGGLGDIRISVTSGGKQ